MQPSTTSNISRKTKYATFLGALAISVGITLILLRNWIPEYALTSIIVLKPNTLFSKTWRKMPVTVPTDVYFFNWTNAVDFHDLNIKPQFEQVGPYRFLQDMEKTNVVWNDNNTVTFNQVRYWQFDGKYTKRKLTDKITSMNAITLSASHHIRNWPYAIKRVVSFLFAAIAPTVQITRTVNQLLFDGYNDIVVDIANYLPFLASEVPRFDKFGWFRLMNGSTTFEGVYNMANGADGSFEILRWNYNNVTPYFNGSCANVHGTGGELYSRNLSKDYIGIFLSHLCRYLQFDFEEEVVVNGILGYKYSIGDSILDNGTKIPGNECYCAGDCMPSGIINVSSCRYGTPTYASLPHFYGADPIYLDEVEGLHPRKKLHEAYIVLEPRSGIILKAVVRLQLNILVHPIDSVSVFEDVRRVYFPLLWAEQNVILPISVEIMLKIYLNGSYLLTGVAVVLIGVGLYLLIWVAFKPLLIRVYKNVYKRRGCQSYSLK